MDIYEFGVVAERTRAAPSGFRLFATDDPPVYHAFTKTIVDPAGRSLNERLVCVLEVDRSHRTADSYEERDVAAPVLREPGRAGRPTPDHDEIERLGHAGGGLLGAEIRASGLVGVDCNGVRWVCSRAPAVDMCGASS